MKELKPGDKVKVWGAALYSAANPNSFVWHRGTQGEVISWYPKYQEDAITVRIGDDNLYFSIRQVEKIEPEKCPATISTDKMLDKCVRAKGHPAQTELLAAARGAMQWLQGDTGFDRLRSAIAACEREEAEGKTEPRGAQIVDLEAALKVSLGQRKA